VSVVLYLLLSGDMLPLGLTLAAIGVVVARWRALIGSLIVWGGLVGVLVSAVPLHPSVYLALLVAGVAWRRGRHAGARLRRGTAAAFVALLAAVLTLHLLGQSRAEIAPSRFKTVVVLGDSISAGLGASLEGAWPQLLATRLQMPVSNLAHAGARLADGIAQARAIPEAPVIVLLELGGNDLLGGTDRARFGSDLRSLLAAVAARDRTVLMFELPLFPLQNSYGRAQRQICREYGVQLVPRFVLAGAVTLEGHTTDGLHLSPAGNAWLAAEVAKYL